MSTKPIPSNCPETSESTCIEIVMAMLGNAIEELRYHIAHPVAKSPRSSHFGHIEKPLAELRWFITSPEGGEMLATFADISSVFQKYRRKAVPLLLKAEALAEAGRKARYNTFPFYHEVISQNPMKMHRVRKPNDLYSSVDKSPSQQSDFFNILFSSSAFGEAL